MSSKRRGTLYVGVTNDLIRRVYEHRSGQCEGFTKKYRCGRLVYYELHSTMSHAIQREKQIKKRSRQYKIGLILSMNHRWEDLYPSII